MPLISVNSPLSRPRLPTRHVPWMQGAERLPGAAGGSFSAGPSIGDLPQDEVPARTLFVRNLSPATDPAELHRAFEVRPPPVTTLPAPLYAPPPILMPGTPAPHADRGRSDLCRLPSGNEVERFELRSAKTIHVTCT